jgi:hypothetical protein
MSSNHRILSSLARPWLFAASITSAALGVAAPALAQDYVALEPMTGKKVSVDGLLSEWPAEFLPLNVTVQGSTVGAQALIGYDAQNLYFALKTKDAQIVRTAAAGPKEDHLSWQVRVPTTGKTYRVAIYPGDPGKLPGLVKVDGKPVPGAEAVENPQKGGFHLEARLPWSALPEVARVRVGLRGVLEYTDASAPGRVSGVVANAKAQGKVMPPFTLESETGLVQSLLEPKQLGVTPAREVYGNVFGDAAIERVAVYGAFLSIVGPGYRSGKQFYFNELHVKDASSVLRLELMDFDGDGREEIVVEKRLGSSEKHRDVLQVLQLGKDGAPRLVFSHETAIKTDEGHLQNEVKLTRKGAKAELLIGQGLVRGIDPATFREPRIDGMPSALLPWETVKTRTFRWQDNGLVASDETFWTPKLKSPSEHSASGNHGNSGTAVSKAPPPPRPPSAEELLDRVYALYRKDRDVGKAAPRFDFVTDLVEDEQTERVLVHGRDIVVFGKGFKKGLSYTYITVGVREPEHILDVTARDLTGDGKAEVIVRGKLHARASEELGGDTVEREALYVYKVIDEQLVRIFAAETGRALGKKRIIGAVAFISNGTGLDITLRPARALGWNERDYPFPEDLQSAGGLEPLLLPWGRQRERTYSFRGNAYEAN